MLWLFVTWVVAGAVGAMASRWLYERGF